MDISDFCGRLARLDLTNLKKALAILWLLDSGDTGHEETASRLAQIISDNHIGNPSAAYLGKELTSSGFTYRRKGRFRLRADRKAEVRSWFEDILVGFTSEVPEASQFLNEQVWKPTRGYIEKVCAQLNGAYHQGFFDCAAVMLRRVVETLIIEAYEHLGREAEIKNDGNYQMLGGLVTAATGSGGLSLGREAKKGLNDIKKLGDRSAHNRKYNAKKSDLDGVQDALRITFEELANTAGLYRS
jgi:hypothetical protein